MNESDIVEFQISRQLKSVAKTSLSLLENSHAYIKKLEKTLSEMGITRYDEGNSDFIYAKDRKSILDKTNDAERELFHLLKSFDVKLKKD